MTDLFSRESDGSYLVRSSSGQGFYRVEMFGLDAVSCQCDYFTKGKKACKHMATAEVAEALYQEKQQQSPEPPMIGLGAELTRPAGFSLLK